MTNLPKAENIIIQKTKKETSRYITREIYNTRMPLQHFLNHFYHFQVLSINKHTIQMDKEPHCT
jgi:hypothetical protein